MITDTRKKLIAIYTYASVYLTHCDEGETVNTETIENWQGAMSSSTNQVLP